MCGPLKIFNSERGWVILKDNENENFLKHQTRLKIHMWCLRLIFQHRIEIRRGEEEEESIKFIILFMHMYLWTWKEFFGKCIFGVREEEHENKKVKKSMLKRWTLIFFLFFFYQSASISLSVCLFNNSFIPGHHHSHDIYALSLLFFSSFNFIYVWS